MTEKESMIELVAFALWYQDDLWEREEDHSLVLLEKGHAKWIADYRLRRTEPHYGDCTGIPMVCIRCLSDELWRTAEQVVDKFIS